MNISHGHSVSHRAESVGARIPLREIMKSSSPLSALPALGVDTVTLSNEATAGQLVTTAHDVTTQTSVFALVAKALAQIARAIYPAA